MPNFNYVSDCTSSIDITWFVLTFNKENNYLFVRNVYVSNFRLHNLLFIHCLLVWVTLHQNNHLPIKATLRQLICYIKLSSIMTKKDLEIASYIIGYVRVCSGSLDYTQHGSLVWPRSASAQRSTAVANRVCILLLL